MAAQGLAPDVADVEDRRGEHNVLHQGFHMYCGRSVLKHALSLLSERSCVHVLDAWQIIESPSATQVMQAWGDIAQQAKEQRCAAEKLHQRRMREALQGFFSGWAAHAEHMRERRQVASAHGDAIAKRLADNCAHMTFLVSTSSCTLYRDS